MDLKYKCIFSFFLNVIFSPLVTASDWCWFFCLLICSFVCCRSWSPLRRKQSTSMEGSRPDPSLHHAQPRPQRNDEDKRERRRDAENERRARERWSFPHHRLFTTRNQVAVTLGRRNPRMNATIKKRHTWIKPVSFLQFSSLSSPSELLSHSPLPQCFFFSASNV